MTDRARMIKSAEILARRGRVYIPWTWILMAAAVITILFLEPCNPTR